MYTRIRIAIIPGSDQDILDHQWFSNIDFDKLTRKRIKPPYVPNITSLTDDSNFGEFADPGRVQRYSGSQKYFADF